MQTTTDALTFITTQSFINLRLLVPAWKFGGKCQSLKVCPKSIKFNLTASKHWAVYPKPKDRAFDDPELRQIMQIKVKIVFT